LREIALSAVHNLDGLIAWSRRDEWRELFGMLLDRHTGRACADAGISLAELGDMLGDDAMSAIFGAVFEDLLALDLPDGRNLADEYLRRRGWKDSAGTRDYIAALRSAPISLFEVSGIVPGEGMALRDLVHGGDPVRVAEKSGSRGVRQWDRIATRLMHVRGRAMVSGVLLPVDHDTADALLAALRGTRAKTVSKGRAAREREVSAVDAAQGDEGADMAQVGSAPLFTHHWLAAALESMRPRQPPQVTNSDGEPLEFVTVHFPLASGATHGAVREALATVPGLRQETASFWNWVEEPGTSMPTRRRPKAQQFITTMDDGAVVLGNLEMKARRLSLTANSEARAIRGQSLLAGALGGLVRATLVERDDMGQSTTKARQQPPQPSGVPPDVERQVISQALDDHYRRILDEPIPPLGNRSPRSAAKTPKGREKVVAWLKRLENHGARHNPDDPMASYDFGWMWRELGVEGLRR